jgi:predicted nucleotidyltransferase
LLSPKSIEYVKSVAARFGASKVLLFGSCLELSEEEANDIDLVVYGLDPLAHWDMMKEMVWPDALGEKRVDLIRAENEEPIMAYAEDGVPIYERDKETATVFGNNSI